MNAEITKLNEMHRRMERDELLSQTVDRINPIRWATMTSEQQTQWSAYRQALLDIPTQSGFPFDVQWPTKPE
jgi:hypothetical protein